MATVSATNRKERVNTPAILIFWGSTSCDIGVHIEESISDWCSEDRERLRFWYADTAPRDNASTNFLHLDIPNRFDEFSPAPWIIECAPSAKHVTLTKNGSHGILANAGVAARYHYSGIRDQVEAMIREVGRDEDPDVRVHIVAFLGGGTVGGLEVLLAALSQCSRDIRRLTVVLHLLMPQRHMIRRPMPDTWYSQQLRNAYQIFQTLRTALSQDYLVTTYPNNEQAHYQAPSLELAILHQPDVEDVPQQNRYVARLLADLLADRWGFGQFWWDRYKQAQEQTIEGGADLEARLCSISCREINLPSRFFDMAAKKYLCRKWSAALFAGTSTTPKRIEVGENLLRSLVPGEEPNPVNDPLSFLTPENLDSSSKEIFEALTNSASIIAARCNRDIETTLQSLVALGKSLEENECKDATTLKNELLSDARRALERETEELKGQIAPKLETLFVHSLIFNPDVNPFDVRLKKVHLSPGRIEPKGVRDLIYNEIRRRDGANEKDLKNIRGQAHAELRAYCQNYVNDVLGALGEKLGRYSGLWAAITAQLKNRASHSGALAQELRDPKNWTFPNDEPTRVTHLFSGELAIAAVENILTAFGEPTNENSYAVAQAVHNTIFSSGQSIGGESSNRRIPVEILESILAEAIAPGIKAAPVEPDWLVHSLSGVSITSRASGVKLGQRKLWRPESADRLSPLDSITMARCDEPGIKQAVTQDLGTEHLSFEPQVGFSGEPYRITIHRSTQGASIRDLNIFQSMVNAWVGWYSDFIKRKGNTYTAGVKKDAMEEMWILYPDMGERNNGVFQAIKRKIGADRAYLESLISIERSAAEPVEVGEQPDSHELALELLSELGFAVES